MRRKNRQRQNGAKIKGEKNNVSASVTQKTRFHQGKTLCS
jgi:hypothetical protein